MNHYRVGKSLRTRSREPTRAERERNRKRWEAWHDSDRYARTCGQCGAPIGDGPVFRGQYRSPVTGKWHKRRNTMCQDCAKGGSWPVTGACETCGRVVHQIARKGRTHTFCCDRCREIHFVAYERRKRQAARNEIECAGCGKRFIPERSDTKTCSPACRQKLHRRRHAVKHRE
jgi:endogenous inhibitor of DNA gyrase (YacG/DUF329 family)